MFQLKQTVTPGGLDCAFSILSFPRTQLGLGHTVDAQTDWNGDLTPPCLTPETSCPLKKSKAIHCL